MFVQVVGDPPEVDRCAAVPGFLGATAGTADDGSFVAIVRFGDEPPTGGGRGTDDIELLGAGFCDEAGYVEVIEGRTADRARFMALERRIEQGYRAERPDFLGSALLFWPDGAWTEVAYFRSQAETRAADEQGLSPPLAALVAEWESVANPSSTVALVDPVPRRP